MTQSKDHQITKSPMVWTVANLLTALRIVLTVPFLYLISKGSYGGALAVFFIASLTDFTDGYVARRFNQRTSVGRIMDPLADKILTTAAYIVMAIPRAGLPSIPIWLAAAVVIRDVVILLGSLIVFLAMRFKQFEPSILGKINTLVELGLIVWFLAFNGISGLGPLRPLLPACYVIVLCSVLLSGGYYILRGIQIIRAGLQSR
jgi:cardiolipin synthase